MQTIEVIPVQNDSNIKIPSNIPPINIGIVDVIRAQQEIIIKKISDKFNLNYSEIIKECLTNTPIVMDNTNNYSVKEKKKDKKIKLENYKNAKEKQELKSFKNNELKNILKKHGLPISGNKQKLIDRVWEISHTTNSIVKNDNENKKPINEEDIICELDFDSCPSIFIDNGKIVEVKSNGNEYKLFKKKFLFIENDTDIKYCGIYDGENINFSNEHEYPSELISLLGL